MNRSEAEKLAKNLVGSPVGGWKLERFLGHGGSAVVFLATDDHRSAAVKIIDPELERRYGPEEQEARIGRELKLVGRSHPNIVQVYDGGRCPVTGLLFLAMQHLPEPDLEGVLAGLPREKIATLIAQLAGAARFLEAQQLVHRDIKPENIKVLGNFEALVLLDMGIARPLVPDPNDAGTGDNFIGTVRYSPPEFVWRKEEDSVEGWRAVTFYQLGAVLHDMIMRRPLFLENKVPPAALYDAVRETVPQIEADDVDLWLIKLATACLQKDPQVRLKLVTWDSFEGTKHVGAPAARARVRQILNSSHNATSQNAKHESFSRIGLENLGRQLREKFRQACLADDALPKMSVDSLVSDGSAWIVATAEASAAHHLHHSLSLLIRARPSTGELVEVSWQGIWGAAPSDLEGIDPQNRMGIIRWPHTDEIEAQLADMLYIALDAALEIQGATDGTILRIR